MDKLLLLHELQKSTRHLYALKDLEFFIPNETYKLIPYEQCIFWICNGTQISIRSVSGGGQLDRTGPFTVWLSTIIKQHKLDNDTEKSLVKIDNIATDNLEDYLKKDWSESMACS